MSRTLHSTFKAPPHNRDEEDLRRKHRVKRLVVEERRQPRALAPGLPCEAVPITVRDRGPFVHYPASVGDLRALLSRLPAGVASGIGSIELLLSEAPCERREAADPFVGRLRREIIAGVFASSVLGQYSSSGARIRLFAYVYDPSRKDRAVVDLYLRLRMLSTFVHELAHHDDFSARAGRRQWRADHLEEREVYAEAMQHAWTQDYVVPYLEEVYPTEVAALREWLEVHGGTSLSLAALAGDPRKSDCLDDAVRQFFSVDQVFQSLLDMVARGKEPPETQVAFADELHYGMNYDEALASLARVLDEHPTNVDALVLRADILLHQDRVEEASEIARSLALTHDTNADVWQVVRDCAQARGDWLEVLAAAEGLVGSNVTRVRISQWNLELQVRACIELGDFERAEDCLARLAEAEPECDAARRRNIDVLVCLLLLRRGEHEAALAGATVLLATDDAEADLRAVRVEAAHALGRPPLAGALDDAAYERLARAGYREWVERLVVLEGRQSRSIRTSSKSVV